MAVTSATNTIISPKIGPRPAPRPKVYMFPAAPKPKRNKRLPLFLLIGTAGLAFFVVAGINETSVISEKNDKTDTRESTVASLIPNPISDAHASTAAGNNDKTIILQGDEGSIVGRMAKISLDNDQITEMKPASDIDKDAGRELLSILNKY